MRLLTTIIWKMCVLELCECGVGRFALNSYFEIGKVVPVKITSIVMKEE